MNGGCSVPAGPFAEAVGEQRGEDVPRVVGNIVAMTGRGGGFAQWAGNPRWRATDGRRAPSGNIHYDGLGFDSAEQQ